MKTLAVLLLFSVFHVHGIAQDTLFVKSESPDGRTLVIEEDTNSVYAYIMQKNNNGIAFHGFLCAVTDPSKNNVDISKTMQAGATPPLTAEFANEFSWVKNLQEKDIDIQWKDNRVEVYIRGDKYLIMDLKRKISYSKALRADGPYGNAMAK